MYGYIRSFLMFSIGHLDEVEKNYHARFIIYSCHVCQAKDPDTGKVKMVIKLR